MSFRPKCLDKRRVLSHSTRAIQNAEDQATWIFKPLVDRGTDRWIQPHKGTDMCRINKALGGSIVHDHVQKCELPSSKGKIHSGWKKKKKEKMRRVKPPSETLD